MTRRIPRCLSYWGPTRGPNATRCQLEQGHDGDHSHSTEGSNYTHTLSWTNTGALTRLRRQP